ncbi:MAG: TolC family protein [bacterium]
MSFIIRFTATPLQGRGRLGSRRAFRPMARRWVMVVPMLAAVVSPSLALAQRDSAVIGSTILDARSAAGGTELDALVATALTRSPTVRAASARVLGARHRAEAASAPPDPMLMAGIQNQPLGSGPASMAVGGPEPMTMRMIGVSQAIPYPGKLALRRRVAEREAEAAEAAVETARRLVARDVKQAYYEIAFIDHARRVVDRNRDVLASVIHITDVRYGLGTLGQTEVLKARLDGTRLAQAASDLAEQRNATLARLSALLDAPIDTGALRPVVPDRIARFVMPEAPDDIRFTSNVLGSRAAGSPLPPLAELQEAALASSPELREHEAMISAQAARVELARTDRLPDVDVSVQYGQRGGGLPDMVSATVSVPLPIFARRKQDQLSGDASAQLEALHAEHQAAANTLRADVASLVSEIERARTQLALYAKALVPQGRAMLTSAIASYQVGKGELRDVLDAQASLFTYETDNARALADFAKQLAELERVVGTEVVR